MGRKVVEATKAWRMRRTRGDIGRFLRFAVVAWGKPVRGFLAEGADFGCADLGVAGFAAVGLWALDFLSEVSEVAGGDACWGKATERVLPRNVHRRPSASGHISLRPNRTTFNFFVRERQNLCIEMLEMTLRDSAAPSDPQGLKPNSYWRLSGTAEAMPLPNPF